MMAASLKQFAGLLAGLAALCVASGAGLKRRDGPCICGLDYTPVCADDNGRRFTLANTCQATCRDATVLHDDKCTLSDCRCPRTYRPVCGEDGEEYNNDCITDCLGVGVESRGPCDRKLAKKQLMMLSKKSNYNDDLSAVQLPYYPDKEDDSPRPVQLPVFPGRRSGEPCSCDLLSNPVCDRKGNEYSNRCFAKCAGVDDDEMFAPPCLVISHHGGN